MKFSTSNFSEEIYYAGDIGTLQMKHLILQLQVQKTNWKIQALGTLRTT